MKTERRVVPERKQGTPTLVLAFGALQPGRTSRRTVPPGGLLLGSGAPVFDVPIPDPRLVPRHAYARRVGGSLMLEDLAAPENATFVNGRRILGEQALVSGDVIRIGDTLLVYAAAGDPPALLDPELVGTSSLIGDVVRSIHAVAKRMHTVVVTGGTGTGKEIVARRIHAVSGRSGPFLAVNCALCSESLLASELFGHVRGAFTGAVADQLGLFRAARGGTILLDEVADMPLGLQAALLRVIETRTVRPVGSTRDIAVDMRVIVTTNQEMVSLVQAGRFRADLYARLAQWTIRIPPLRARREDIPAVVAQLLPRCDAAGRHLSPDLAEALLIHDWPLNVRGLLNILSIAAISSPESGPLRLTDDVRIALAQSRTMSPEPISDDSAPEQNFDKESLEDLLRRFRGRVASAARHVGVTRPRFYRLLAVHDIVPASFRGP